MAHDLPLTEREEEIIAIRYRTWRGTELDGPGGIVERLPSLRAVGQALGISGERVRQIEKRAIDKIVMAKWRKEMKEEVPIFKGTDRDYLRHIADALWAKKSLPEVKPFFKPPRVYREPSLIQPTLGQTFRALRRRKHIGIPEASSIIQKRTGNDRYERLWLVKFEGDRVQLPPDKDMIAIIGFYVEGLEVGEAAKVIGHLAILAEQIEEDHQHAG